MNARIFVILCIASLLSSGCVAASLRSARSPGNVVHEPRLFGRWHGVSRPSSGFLFDDTYWEPGGDWVVEGAPDSSFRATQHDGDMVIVYAGSVIRLGKDLFLDLHPDSAESARSRVFPVLPSHVFASLRFDGDTLIVGYLRTEWLKRAAEDGRLPRGAGLVMTEEDEGLLTGETSEMQALLAIAAKDARAFSIGKLVRNR